MGRQGGVESEATSQTGSTMKPSYADCFFGGGSVEERLIQREVWRKGQRIIIEKAPIGVCKQCGEKVVLPEGARRIDGILKKPGSPHKVVAVPVYSLS